MATTKNDIKSVRLESVDIWAADDGHIHITSDDPDAPNFHTTINNTPGSKRYHANAYRKLAEILIRMGKQVPGWEPPATGYGSEESADDEQGGAS